ncbi:SDR family oxidoreductase [Acinetobacter ihumii]|uniref:SDR family oxidoreductase n=1 Tax=Acinetobacter ihumii TaxID=2483802 RepID=UPI00102FFF19|nr:SDR family oxidoreductase [Acinetobacter ihumii]
MSKKILITGAGTGFGKATAFKLAKLGYQVIATVEAVAQIYALEQEAQQQGLSIQVEKLDITDDLDREFIANFDIDILLNNAGISEGGAVVDIPEYRLREQFEVNVFGTILLTQKFAKKFAKRQSGKIIFISSVAGLTTDPFTGAYSASKHAIEAFAEALNKELHEYNVKIATVNPGPILTGFNDRMFETWKHWYPEDQADALFDYSQLSFPHQQYEPDQVSDIIVDVVTEQQKTYRNLAPKEIEADTKKQMHEKWDRLIHSDAQRDPLVEDAYELEPETPNGK